MAKELETKLAKIQEMHSAHQLDALLLQKVDNFAWATCGGASYINSADIMGVGALLITPSGRYLVTNNIEAPRFRQEEHLEKQASEKAETVMYHLDRLINAINDLDSLINEYRGLGGSDPTQRPFFISTKYQWALNHLTGLKAWQRHYQDTFGGQINVD